MTSLTYLSLGWNQIIDISALSGLTSLRDLYLGGNQIIDISKLSGLTSLRDLDLYGNQIIDISKLSNLKQLTDLDLRNNQIIDISALSGLTSLRDLYLGGNQIIDISKLSNLKQLTDLDLRNNQIIDISALSGLTSLRDLYLGGNQIIDFTPLIGLTSLNLDLGNSRIRDLVETADPAASENGVMSKKRTVVIRCPVGWQRQNGFGTPTPRVLISAVEVEIDSQNRHGIYTSVAIEIYADPSQKRQDLDGWKLKLAIPYNSGTDYSLTSENSNFDESGILRIESSEVPTGLPMADAVFSGRVLPGFDYRLFDEKHNRVDFAISCYLGTSEKGYGLLADRHSLQAMTVPRLERNIVLESFAWDADYYRSEWRTPETLPAAPSNPYKRLTTMWADLKKQKQ